MHIGEDKAARDFTTAISTITQILAVVAALKPIISLAGETVGKWLSKIKKPTILRRMIGYTGRNCKLRSLAYSVADSIIDTIQHKPGGYTFWQSLPKKGQNNQETIRKGIADTLLTSLYDSSFIAMLLKAAMDESGRPLLHSPLYRWLLTNIYSDNVGKLYQDWVRVTKVKDTE